MYYIIIRLNKRTGYRSIKRIYKQRPAAERTANRFNNLMAPYIIYHIVELDILSILKEQGNL